VLKSQIKNVEIDNTFMKKILLTGIIISVLFWGCKKEDEEIDYASLILGAWVNTHIDNESVLTDAAFSFEYRSDNVQSFANGYVLDGSNKTWMESENYTYSVNGNRIIIDGLNVLGSHFHMEFDILFIDQSTFKYSVSKFLIDDVEFPDAKTYTNKKITTDLTSQFVGTWYGRTTTTGSIDDNYYYWDYFADGHFDYYFQDDEGNWVNKPDNEGNYFLYGDFLASNFTNDLLSGETGKAYECWNISIENNTMYWTGLRDNGQITSFQMEKVDSPPSGMPLMK
jgi:hypothetical protein